MQISQMGAPSVHSSDDGTSEDSTMLPTVSAASTCASTADVGPNRRRAGEKTRALFVKTEYCRFHAEGKCSRGQSCSFAHGNTELRVRPDLTNTTICHFWVKGRCLQGPDCAFAHGVDELRSVPGKPKPRRIRASRARQPSPPGEETQGLAPFALESALPFAPGPIQKPDAHAVPRTCTRCCGTITDAYARFCSICGAGLVGTPAPQAFGPVVQMVQVVTPTGPALMAMVPHIPGRKCMEGPAAAEAAPSIPGAAPNRLTPNLSGFQQACSASQPLPRENPWMVSAVLSYLGHHEEVYED